MKLDLDALEQQWTLNHRLRCSTPIFSDEILPLIRIARAAVTFRDTPITGRDFESVEWRTLLDALREAGL